MFNVTLEFDSIDKILDNHGLGPGGVGQNFVDNEVILLRSQSPIRYRYIEK